VLGSADEVVPVLADRAHAADLAADALVLDQRIARHDAWLPLRLALDALKTGFVNVAAAVVTGSGGQVLTDVAIHIDLEHPVSDFVAVAGTHQVLLGQADVVRRGDISFFKVSVVVDPVIVRILDSVVKVNIPVVKDKGKVVLFHLLVGLACFEEGLVGSDFFAVSEETCAKFCGDAVELEALALTLEEE